MTTQKILYPQMFNASMMAACGMNCSLCLAYQREKKPCAGCNGEDTNKPQHCVVCRIKNCAGLGDGEAKFCFVCAKFPCARLKQLDKRYRLKYGMSMIENLVSIRDLGMDEMIRREMLRWQCPGCGGVICVHSEHCMYCGWVRSDTAAAR